MLRSKKSAELRISGYISTIVVGLKTYLRHLLFQSALVELIGYKETGCYLKRLQTSYQQKIALEADFLPVPVILCLTKLLVWYVKSATFSSSV